MGMSRRDGSRGTSAELHELARKIRQNVWSISCEHHVVLDSYAAPPGAIDPRLDRHHGALREGPFRGPRQARRLVNFEPDAVPEAVAEQVAKSSPLNVVTRDGIGIPSAHSGPDAMRRALVR